MNAYVIMHNIIFKEECDNSLFDQGWQFHAALALHVTLGIRVYPKYRIGLFRVKLIRISGKATGNFHKFVLPYSGTWNFGSMPR
jgi:hypothetical protein